MLRNLLILVATLFASSSAFAAEGATNLGLTSSGAGIAAIVIFVVAYLLVVGEEKLQLQKSIPVLFGACLIWVLVALKGSALGQTELVQNAFSHNFLEFGELMLFLIVAMTYISAMEERNVFEALRSWLVRKGFTYKALFWITGILAFFISPVADNLTTALLMCAVVMKVAEGQGRFIAISCINIVVAANAGGAFSPFGDLTTLMVWQAGKVEFFEFFVLFIPSVINFVLPAAIMTLFLPSGKPGSADESVPVSRGGIAVVMLFLATITTAVVGNNVLGLPPVFGMLMGLSYLLIFTYYLRLTTPAATTQAYEAAELAGNKEEVSRLKIGMSFDVFGNVAKADWDTLLFFYGVVLCVGGLGLFGYLEMASAMLFSEQGPGPGLAAFYIGIISAVVDNIPVMFAVLTMSPEISHGHWLLVTLTAGVGGSLLSVGSAAGVALMGAARGHYTFMSHLKWLPVIFVGYVASFYAHILINGHLFDVL